jgi:4'-phosphopantetheinyl transferase EntD
MECSVVLDALAACPLRDAILVSEGGLAAPPVRLTSQERAALAGAVGRRVREFASGRQRARDVCGQLGAEDTAIGVDSVGAPIWPAGLTGSITHTASHVAAAAGQRDRVGAVGIDVEPAVPVPRRVAERVATPTELVRLGHLYRVDRNIPWDHLLFSSKEATYKANYVLYSEGLRFHDIDVVFDLDGSLRASTRNDSFTGGWAVCSGLLATAIVVTTPGCGIRQPALR